MPETKSLAQLIAEDQDKFKQHVDGLLTEFSIGYQNIVTEKVLDENEEVNHWKLIELKLWEYSSVTWGANALTHIVDMKSEDVDETLKSINTRMDRLTKALKKGDYTDETCEQFEIELKQIQTIYNELIKRDEPGKPTHREPGDDPTLQEAFKELKNIFDYGN